MTQMAHGLGTLTGKTAAELKIPEAQARQIASGQAAFIDTRAGVMQGTVVGINPAVDGSVTVKVHLEGDLPAGVRPGIEVDGTIHIAELKDVMASEARSVRTNSQPLTNPPDALQNTAPFSSASATSSSVCA